MTDWWYAKKDKKNGPFQKEDLVKLIQNGKIESSTLLWTEGMESWLTFDEIPELQALKSVVPPQLPTTQKISASPVIYPNASSWSRFYARLFDTWLEMSFVTLAVVIVMVLIFDNLTSDYWLLILISLLSIAITLALDAVIYKVFGNTPGKALLGLKVVMPDASPLKFRQYLFRNFSMWLKGQALSIPLIQFIAMYYQFHRLSEGDNASYDESTGYRVGSKPISLLRKAIFCAAFLAVFSIMTVSSTLIKIAFVKSLPENAINYSFWVNPVTNIGESIDSSWRYTVQSDVNGQQTYMFSEKEDRSLVVLGVQNIPEYTLKEYVDAFKISIAKNVIIPSEGNFYNENGREVWRGTGRTVEFESAIDNESVDVKIVKLGDDFWRVVTVKKGLLKDTDYSILILHHSLWRTVL